MPGVGVAQGAKSLVVAADECGAGVNPSRSFHQAAVEVNTERDHGFGFVDVRRRKEFSPESAKYLGRSREDGLIVLATSGNIEQAEQYPFRADSQGVIKISSNPFSVGGGGNLCALDLRELSRDRLHGWRDLGYAGLE